MSEGNGFSARVADVERDHRDLRQLMLDEFRALRAEVKHIGAQLKLMGEAVDTILETLKEEEADSG